MDFGLTKQEIERLFIRIVNDQGRGDFNEKKVASALSVIILENNKKILRVLRDSGVELKGAEDIDFLH